MTSGYLIAVLCETVGLVGLFVGLSVLRAERLAKASELRGFLRSGQSAGLRPLAPPAHRRAGTMRTSERPFTVAPARGSAVGPSAAQAALLRALDRR